MSSLSDSLETLSQKLKSSPEKNQFRLIDELKAAGEPGLAILMDNLLERQSAWLPEANSQVSGLPDLIAGKIYQALFNANSEQVTEWLQTQFPLGVVPLRSQSNIDYLPLQRLLAEQKFQDADQLTLQKLCELAGTSAIQRKWVYFTEVEQFAIADLQTLNALWMVHSEGKFGFSVQRELWLGVGKNWEKLWSKIGWKTGNAWTRYPQEFTWNLTAPPGHLPLSNQLRGVRTFAALLAHPAWN
jgi:hypothetical protein